MRPGAGEEDTLEGRGGKLAIAGAVLALALCVLSACRTDDVVIPGPGEEPPAGQAPSAVDAAEATGTPVPPHMATQIAARAEGYKTFYIVTDPQPGIYGFQPNSLTLEAGDNVRLLLKGTVEPEGYGYHTFTLPSQGFSVLVPERTKSVWLTFDEPGEFEFYCIPHPWMRGTITVVPEGELPPPDSG